MDREGLAVGIARMVRIVAIMVVIASGLAVAGNAAASDTVDTVDPRWHEFVVANPPVGAHGCSLGSACSISRASLAAVAKPRVASQDWNRDRRSDAELLVDTRRDPEAFDEFYKRNFSRLTAYFWHRTRDRDTTSELIAETFTVMLESIGRYDPAKGNSRQWLYGIANNQLKRFWRSKRVSMNARHRLGIQTPPTATTGWEEIEAAEDRIDAARMVEALDRLPSRTREAVRLRVMEQLDYRDIAQRLGCSPKSARDLVFRGLRRLKTEFGPASFGDEP